MPDTFELWPAAACAKEAGHYFVPKVGKQPAACKSCFAGDSKQASSISGTICYNTVGNGNSCSATHDSHSQHMPLENPNDLGWLDSVQTIIEKVSQHTYGCRVAFRVQKPFYLLGSRSDACVAVLQRHLRWKWVTCMKSPTHSARSLWALPIT